MYQPTAGRITVDGPDLAGIEPASWRSATTGAFQDFARFAMSLRRRGRYRRPASYWRHARRARRARAGAGAGCPGRGGCPSGALGLDTLLGPLIGGRSLSGGQWQRAGPGPRPDARTRRCLVVLDEPTASLDAPSEAALFASYRDAAQEAAGTGHGTITVLVSHRFGTVHMADQIIVMDGGHVAEEGDHAELLCRKGTYAELFTLQTAGYLGD